MIGYTFIIKAVVKGKVEILLCKILPDLDNGSICIPSLIQTLNFPQTKNKPKKAYLKPFQLVLLFAYAC